MTKPLLRFHLAMLFGTVAGCTAGHVQSNRPFQAQLERHIAAIERRDLAGVEATITTGPQLLLILPSGRITRSRDEYVAFHRTLFADDRWVATFEPVETRTLGGYAHALYRVTFDGDGDGPAPASSAHLTLGFALEEGAWRLVHDQNTPVAATP